VLFYIREIIYVTIWTIKFEVCVYEQVTDREERKREKERKKKRIRPVISKHICTRNFILQMESDINNFSYIRKHTIGYN